MWPVSVLEDVGLRDVLRSATGDATFNLPGRTSVMEKVKDLFDREKQKQMQQLSLADSVVLAFDHWTSITQLFFDRIIQSETHYSRHLL